jgi:hypothetical protein
MARKRPAARADQPRPSKAVRALREALGLDEADWREFLWHARDGFADLEQADCVAPETTLRLCDVPDDWFEDPEALGYVAVRVLNEGKATLATPVATHFLRVCDPEPGSFRCPPGIGLAWLHRAREGLAPALEPARLAHLALHMPGKVFHGVAEDDLSRLSRPILEGRGTVEAWDLHALLAAVERARISVRAPFRLFNDLMAAEWIVAAVKREFCRGLLACSPEAECFRERGESLLVAIRADADRMLQTPMTWLELCRGGLRLMLPGLQRHAVHALAEDVGEPLRGVLAEFFLRPDRDPQSADAVTQGTLDLVRLHAEELEPDDVRSLLRKAIKAGSAVVRQAAYRVGAGRFGPAFARPALQDNARMVRDWAGQLLARDAGQSGRKATPGRHASPPGE